MKPYRSVLFVPGHKPDWVEKAAKRSPDAIVLDLEDSVPQDLKATARGVVRTSIEALRGTTDVFVRPNSLDTRLTGLDLEEVITDGLAGVFAPKIATAADVIRYEALIDFFEVRADIEGVELIVPVETVHAIQNCAEICIASPRVGAMVGPAAEYADIARAVGYQWTAAGLETLYLRSRVLIACRAASIHPLTGLWEDVRDLEGLRAFAKQGRQLGFGGQVVIHPGHVEIVNDAYSPTADELEFYIGLVAAYEDAVSAGEGALLYRGLHIDAAHAATAREWLSRAGNLPDRTTT